VLGLLDHARDQAVLLHDHEVAADRGRVGLLLHGQHRAHAVLAEERGHRAQVAVHEDDVAQEEHEGPVDALLELAHRVGDAERRALVDVLDRHAEAPAVAQATHDLVAQVPDHDEHALHPEVAQALDLVLDERLAQHREHGLGEVLGEGRDARALSRGEDDAEQVGSRGCRCAHGSTIIRARKSFNLPRR